jgi:hypothetical protein
MNKYDVNHRVTHHPKMTDAEWEEAYHAAWEAFYTPDHVRTIMRRSAACKRGRPETTIDTILWFYLMIHFEGVHPLEGGAFRMKFRRDRRFGTERESPFVFYPRYIIETATKMLGYWRVYRRFKTMRAEVLAAPDRWTYSDVAITPPNAAEFENLSLYHETAGGEAALARKRRDDAIRAPTQTRSIQHAPADEPTHAG